MYALFCSHLLWLLVHCKHLTHSQGHSDLCKFLYLMKPWPTKELSQAIQVSHQSQNPVESASFLSCEHISIWPSVFGCQTQSLIFNSPWNACLFVILQSFILMETTEGNHQAQEPVHPKLTSLVFLNVMQSFSQGERDSSMTQCLCLSELTLSNPSPWFLVSWAGLWQFFFIACLKVVFTHFKKFHCWLIPS